MNACIKAVFAIILVAIISIAPIAVGQTTGNGGVITQAVSPSVLPDSLPIGNDRVMLDWIVTNKQWYQKAKPLAAFTVIAVEYTSTNGVRGERSFGLTDYEFTSYTDFEFNIGKFGMRLVEKIRNDPIVDRSVPLSMYAYHAYTDAGSANNAMGVYLEKNLDTPFRVTLETFKDFNIVAKQVIVRIPNLERLEVEVNVEGDFLYNYVWTSRSSSAKPSSATIPEERTTKDFVALQDWYSKGDYKAKFKITAGGVTKEYTQWGSRIMPPKVRLNRAVESASINVLDVEFTLGTQTTVEFSTDLKNWYEAWTIPWDIGERIVSIPYYTGSSSVIEENTFFRARSQ